MFNYYDNDAAHLTTWQAEVRRLAAAHGVAVYRFESGEEEDARTQGKGHPSPDHRSWRLVSAEGEVLILAFAADDGYGTIFEQDTTHPVPKVRREGERVSFPLGWRHLRRFFADFAAGTLDFGPGGW